MTNQEILQKAIEKAVDNGWNPTNDTRVKKRSTHIRNAWLMISSFNNEYGYWEEPDLDWENTILFDHNFAKAFFGVDQICNTCKNDWDNLICPFKTAKRWEWHLQQIVLEEDPIEYISKFI